MCEYRLVQRAGTKASTNDEHRFLLRVEPQAVDGLIACQGGLEHLLTYRVAREHDAVGREEALHAFEGYTATGCFLC